jgi:hypothetical protein
MQVVAYEPSHYQPVQIRLLPAWQLLAKRPMSISKDVNNYFQRT